MIGERRSFWRKAAPPLPQTCQCGSRPPPHLSRLFTGGEAARRSVSRTAVNNERSLSSSFVQSGACVHRNNRRHPVRESRRAAFSRFPVSLFSFEIYTVGEICIRECCGQGFGKHESLWKGRDGVWGREGKAFLQKNVPSLPQSPSKPLALAREMIKPAGHGDTVDADHAAFGDFAEHGGFGVGDHDVYGKLG